MVRKRVELQSGALDLSAELPFRSAGRLYQTFAEQGIEAGDGLLESLGTVG